MLGALFGIPEVTTAEGETLRAQRRRRPSPAEASVALEPGAVAFWDNSAHAVRPPAAAKFKIGTVIEHAGSSNATVLVRLDGIATAAV